MTREEPCLMCGGVIVADPQDPGAAVLAHVRSDRHRAAQGVRVTRMCQGCRMVTIPAWRDLCHGCRRTAELRAVAA